MTAERPGIGARIRRLVTAAARKTTPAGRATATVKAGTPKTTASKTSTTKATTGRAAAKKSPVKKATTTRAPVKKATTAGKAAATKKTAAKAQATKTQATKTQATKTQAAKPAPAARKPPAAKQAAAKPAKRASAEPPTAKRTPAKRSSASKPPAQRFTAGRATAATAGPQVLPHEEPWTRAELTEVRAELDEQAAALRAEIVEADSTLAALQRGVGDGAGDDQADAGSKTFEREHEMSLAANSRDLLAQVGHALQRLDDGSYGVCESCGNPIGKARLQAAPRATLCMTCKQRQERR